MGVRERQLRDRENLRRAILDAARELFVAEGYPHVSMRRLAQRIEYSPATIYGYFESKDAIFFALAEEGFQLLHQMARSAEPGPRALDTLRNRMWAFYEFSREHPEYFALMFLDRSVPRIRTDYPRFTHLMAMKGRMADVFEACVAQGDLPADLDPIAAFRVLSSALLGAATARVCERLAPDEDADALARDVLESALDGLRTGRRLTFVPSAMRTDGPGAAGPPPGA